MDITKFGEFKTGILVPIKVNERVDDHAFVPKRVPPAWTPNDKLWPLIVEARDRVAKLDGAGGILPNPALLLRPLQRREAIKSNSIEGTYVTPEELLLFEAEQNQSKGSPNERQAAWQDVLQYDIALSRGCRMIRQGHEIDRVLMCHLHGILLRSARGRDKNPGELRDAQVYVEAGRRYIPPPADMIDDCLSNLESYFATTDDCDPLVRAFIAHYQFEAIHPFKDGNGRLGRLILSLCIYKWLSHSHAWLYLSEFFDKNRTEYINRLFSVSTSQEWDEWIEFCLLGTIEQAESAIDRCQQLDEIKRRYEQDAGCLSVRMHSIISKLLSNPIVESTELAEDLKVSYNTARSDIDKLVKAGILAEMPEQRPKAYLAREIFDVAYLN